MSHSVRACCCIMTFTSMTVWLMNRLPSSPGGGVAEWVRALAWTGDRPVPRRVPIPLRKISIRNFGNSVYPALPVSFGGDIKSRRSLLSGVYARGSKISHQSALQCVTVVNSTTHSKPSPVRPLWHWRTALYYKFNTRQDPHTGRQIIRSRQEMKHESNEHIRIITYKLDG